MEYTNDRISLPGRKRKQSDFQPDSEEIESAIRSFINDDGKITPLDYRPSLHELKGNYQSERAINLSSFI
ncbi:hypothetical protein KAR91_46010 [Candidatus Pacearchaeota archaeon]|nr:hypothetical protein [Candidatus Pacearchaeota archaeon]